MPEMLAQPRLKLRDYLTIALAVGLVFLTAVDFSVEKAVFATLMIGLIWYNRRKRIEKERKESIGSAPML